MLSNRPVEALADLIAEVFRLNGRLIAAGDALVAALGLTGARWQVLGSIAKAADSQTVASVARDRGLTRQSVQRLVDDLVRDGLIETRANPRHRRAYLLVLTEQGQELHRAADALALPWLAELAGGASVETMTAATQALAGIRRRLDDTGD